MNDQRLTTIQKRGNLNATYRFGDPGPGGAYHDYDIYDADIVSIETAEPILCIQFQKGARRVPEARRGVLDVDLLEIVRDRLTCFQQGEFATPENAHALHHIEEALLWMNKRVEDRLERNVLGTYNK